MKKPLLLRFVKFSGTEDFNGKRIQKIISFLKNYQTHTNARGYVLGISGGKDSTIVAKLLVDAIGKENVLGVLMPNREQKDISDSLEVCKYLDIRHILINISHPLPHC